MKLRTLLASLAILAVAARGATDEKPLLRGLIETNAAQRFLLSSQGGTAEKWVAVGDAYQGWTVGEWKAKQRVLVLKGSDGAQVELSMEQSATGEADAAPDPNAALAQAQGIMDKMHFSQMMARVIDQQKVSAAKMTRQMLAQRGMTPAQIDQTLAGQAKVMDAMWGSLDMKDLESQMAQIYSETFTPDELKGMADFYDTPAGQATIAKQPEVQQKLMAVMMPKMMAAAQQAQAEMMKPAAPAPAPAPAATPKP